MTHAAESTHWYAPDGSPQYTVKAKDGSDRATTLRDARKSNLVPSVTTIIRCASAPGLDIWKQKQVLLSALTLPRYRMESDESFMHRVMVDSKEQARKAAEKGTAIHAAIQGHYEGVPPSQEYWKYVNGAATAIQEYFGRKEWIAERSFTHALGFGGKIDLHSSDVLLDFKTKEFAPDEKLSTWDEHHMQIAAYQQGVKMVGKRGAICYVSTTYPGTAKVLEIGSIELLRGWEMFQGLHRYWCSKNNYFPRRSNPVPPQAPQSPPLLPGEPVGGTEPKAAAAEAMAGHQEGVHTRVDTQLPSVAAAPHVERIRL